MKLKIAILEIALLGGICISALLLPRSFPLYWFLAISLGVLVAGNVILFSALKKGRARGGVAYRIGPIAYIALALSILYWILTFLLHKNS
jgi:hypothetical protein